jgi:hypothetical protein
MAFDSGFWRSSLWCTLAVGALASSGCRFGSAAFSSTIDEVGFDAGGTVFSYLDERDANLAVDTDPRVAVSMSWIVFNPAGDLSDVDGASLASMAHELEVRDTLSLVFAHQGDVDADATFSVVKEGDDIVEGDSLDFTLHFAPERLSSASSYEELVPLGSRRSLEVTIDDARFAEGDAVVAGHFTLDVEAIAGRDIGKAREGSIEGSFVAPLVQERVAEKNLALLNAAAATDGVLGLPLPARSTP